MACCATTSKCFLAILNLIFMLVSFFLIIVGSWIFADYAHYHSFTSNITTALLPACIILAVGIILFLLAFIGCVASFKEQKCLIGLYYTLLLVLFVGCTGGIITAYYFRDKIDTTLHKTMLEELNKYQPSTVVYDEINFMQSNLKCCGVDNFTDWVLTPWYKNQTGKKVPYPESCCMNKNCSYNSTHTYNSTHSDVFEEGCYTKLRKEFMEHFVVIGWSAIACSVILLFGMIFSCVLLCHRRTEIPYIGLSNPDGMHV